MRICAVRDLYVTVVLYLVSGETTGTTRNAETGLARKCYRGSGFDQQRSKCYPTGQIILAGISQGCATAIHALFNSGHRFGGFIGLSGWLPYVRQIEDICRAQSEAVERIQYIKAISGRNREVSAASGIDACLETPIFLGHCKDDEVVPYMNGEALCKGLQDLGMQVEWHAYEDGGHWLNEPEGLDDLIGFLKYCSKSSSARRDTGPSPPSLSHQPPLTHEYK
jgi:predicted esterase